MIFVSTVCSQLVKQYGVFFFLNRLLYTLHLYIISGAPMDKRVRVKFKIWHPIGYIILVLCKMNRHFIVFCEGSQAGFDRRPSSQRITLQWSS